MSTYRRSEYDYDRSYSGAPQAERWDSARFSRESANRRGAPVIEQRPPYESSRRGEPAYYDDRRYYEDDYYSGPRGSRDRRFYEEDEYYDPRANQGAMVPFRPEAPPRPSAPPRPVARPRMVRRQSSVDRIDFERRRYYDDYRSPPPPPPAREPPRSSRYDIRIYDDVKVQDPEYYGDDGFREYREREWTRSRARSHSRSPSPAPRAPTRASTHVSSHSEFVEAAPPEAYEEEKVVEETKIVEKPYPRRGKTRMPKRLVHTKALYDLGYAFYEEDEKTILIEKALGPDNIDEVFAKSKEYRELEITTKAIEAPPETIIASPPPRPMSQWDGFNARSPSPGSSVSQATRKSSRRSKSQATSRRGSMHESIHKSFHETDRESRGGGHSVHESFHESIHRSRSNSPAPTGRSSRRSRAKSQSRHSSRSSDTTIIERKETIISERSPARTSRSRRGTSVGGADIIERKIIERDEIDESNSIDIGPLSLVRAKSRTDAEIRDEIARLERERRDIRRDTETIRYDRRSRRASSPLGVLREPSPRGEIIIADRRDDEVVAVRKDKRARSRSRPPGPGLLKTMMYTVT